MPVRRPSSRGKPSSVRVSLPSFGWDPATIVSIRQAALPWAASFEAEVELKGQPLADARLNERDGLSAVGQYAAHLAFLRFAGIPDENFLPEEWIVRRTRGADCELLRLRAAGGAQSGLVDPLRLVRKFADAAGVRSMDILGEAWSSPEAVYADVERRLADAAVADRSHFRRSGWGLLVSPGPEALGRIARTPGSVFVAGERAAIEAIKRFAGLAEIEVVVLAGADSSPLRRRSALTAFRSLGVDLESSSGEIVDSFASWLEGRHAIAVVEEPERFDEESRVVLRTIADAVPSLSWVLSSDAPELISVERPRQDVIETRHFVVSPSLGTWKLLESIIAVFPGEERTGWVEGFVAGDAFSEYLLERALPRDRARGDVSQIPEPRRSYLGVVALAGPSVETSIARAVLDAVDCGLSMEEVLGEEAVSDKENEVRFRSESRREQLAALVVENRGAPAAVAEAFERAGDPARALRVAIEAGLSDRVDRLVRMVGGDLDELESGLGVALSRTRREILEASPLLGTIRCRRLLRQGRYQDARRDLPLVEPAKRPELLALIERRLGNYAAALEALSSAPGETSFGAEILRVEIQRLCGDFSPAAESLERCSDIAMDDADRERLAYEKAVLALDQKKNPTKWKETESDLGSYLSSRYECYVSLQQGRYSNAVDYSLRAIDLAPSVPDRIDAALDRMYAWFLDGDWTEARHAAADALRIVEETQGDRAAGGILFTLAYLSADDGYWDRARDLIGRLDEFYAKTGDATRRSEIGLLQAHLALCQLRFDEAKVHIHRFDQRRVSGDIRQAALLIRDEIDWIEGELPLVRTTNETQCRELEGRHYLNEARAFGRVSDKADGFHRRLAEWEQDVLNGRSVDPPVTSNRSEELRLLRSLVALSRRGSSPGLAAAAERISNRFELDTGSIFGQDAPAATSAELDLLSGILRAEFPPDPEDLPSFSFRIASRNRLGRWSQWGSLPVMDDGDLETILEDPSGDWIRAGDETIVLVAGMAQWSREARESVGRVVELKREQANQIRIRRAQDEVAESTATGHGGMVGESHLMVDLLGRVSRLAARDVPVCIEGESGTGKELLARAVHEKSARRQGRFTPVNCAALPENLIESELFGHAKGAFTGADRERAGLIETTDGGTLFLDEIGELPLTAQAKILRFLQEGEYRRVGDSVTLTADVRIVAATNRRLETEVDEGRFRQDLYYRIKVVEVRVPPLRERGRDVILLARHFLELERARHHAGPARLAPDVEDLMLAFAWPGNVRELQNAIRGAHAMAGDVPEIGVEHLPEKLRELEVRSGKKGTYYEEVEALRKEIIERALAETGGNQNQAARNLGMTRQALAYQIKELGIVVKKGR